MEENIDILKGKTLEAITVSAEGNEVLLRTLEGDAYRLYHSQDCCESVRLEEVVGHLGDLIGSPILEAEEASGSNDGSRPDVGESYTWTFYKLGTISGHVTLRWLGESNGYYSEAVSFEKIEP